MRSIKPVKISAIFAIMLFCLVSISASYAGFIAHIQLRGEVDTWTPSGNCQSAGFWKTECKYWLEETGQYHVSYEDLITYLEEVYTLYYDEVFGWLDSEIGMDNISIQEAYDILAIQGGTMEQKLRRQLLAAELNHVSDDYQADDGLFSLFIRNAEEALTMGYSSEYEYYKDVLESYNTLN